MDHIERRDALLARRLNLVAGVRALTAEAQRLSQKLAAVEMEVLRLELDIERNGANPQLVRDLHEVEESAAAFRNACTACQERVAAAESDIDDVDRSLAETGS